MEYSANNLRNGNIFFFDTLQEYQRKAGNSESLELECHSSDIARACFNAFHVCMGNIADWFNFVDSLSELDKVKMIYLAGDDNTIKEAIDRMPDFNIYKGNGEDFAQWFFDDNFLELIPEDFQDYINYSRWAADYFGNGKGRIIELFGLKYVLYDLH